MICCGKPVLYIVQSKSITDIGYADVNKVCAIFGLLGELIYVKGTGKFLQILPATGKFKYMSYFLEHI